MIPAVVQPSLVRSLPPAVRAALVVLAVLAMALGLMHYATGGRVAYTMDSLTYRDAALQFLAGHPMQATNVFAPVPELQPLVHWPPAYPALWAAALSLGNGDIDKVSSWLNPLLLMFTSLSIFWICRMVTGSALIAGAMALVNAFTPMSMIVYGHAWSETLFIPLILLAYAAFWKYRISREKFIWLAVAAVLIGSSNWVRYAGAVFLPLLGFSVFAASGSALGKRIAHAAGAMLLGAAAVLPLWLRNWQLTGNISGSNRGGVTRMDRLFEDMATIVDLFEHSFFAFSMVLRANLEVPILIAAAFVAYQAFRRSGARWLRPPEIWLPLVWLAGYLAFLLYARKVQVTVDLDLRMLAVGFPFLLVAMAPAVRAAFSERSLETRKVLMALLLGLLVNAGLEQAQRVHNNYAADGVPRWRSNFGLGFRDLRDTTRSSRALKESIGPVDSSTVVLTDYRALYLRYLTGAKVYSPGNGCAYWKEAPDGGMLFIGAVALPDWAADCLERKPQWRLLRPGGKAAPSMYAD
jgi:4-amino-4-deoxy-L-arabinose transferase-like glycosyltransferase